jgi:uncharacterized protein
MLSKIRIKNFKSIDDLTIDFSYAEGKAPNNYKESNMLAFLEPNKNVKDRKIPVLAIYGANASGKSNLVEAILFLFGIIENGFNPLVFNPNKLSTSIKETSSVELELFINSKKVKYYLEYNQNSITRELFTNSEDILFEVSNGKLSQYKNLETKMFHKKDFDEIFKTVCLSENNNQIIQFNTFLKAITNKLPGLNKLLTQTSDYFKKKIIIGMENNINPMLSIDEMSTAYEYLNIQELLNKILKIMQKLNIDISRLEYKRNTYPRVPFINPIDLADKSVKIEGNNITAMEIIPYHKNTEGIDIPFNFKKEESLGTQLAFGLIGPILKTLEIGGVLIVDEIDNSLHPLILVPLIKMFKDKKYNKNNAQLIFTLHTTEILDEEDFRVSEFLFMNKSQKKGTFAKRLSDFEDARNDVKFRKRYLKGFYLGIPYPTL